jgi:hypothetical protein
MYHTAILEVNRSDSCIFITCYSHLNFWVCLVTQNKNEIKISFWHTFHAQITLCEKLSFSRINRTEKVSSICAYLEGTKRFSHSISNFWPLIGLEKYSSLSLWLLTATLRMLSPGYFFLNLKYTFQAYVYLTVTRIIFKIHKFLLLHQV